jgi:hypothetical protein
MPNLRTMKDLVLGLPKKVAEHLLVRGIVALIFLAAAALFLFVRDSEDVEVPPALLVLGGALIGLLTVLAVVFFVRGRRVQSSYQVHTAYAQVLYQALETLQKSAHDRGNIDEVIEKGILYPFRDLLLGAIKGGDVRLSILVLGEDRRWAMAFQAGHHLASQQAFDLAYEKSFSRFAYESGKIEYSNKLSSDPRFKQHPEAQPGREYNSIVSVPILVGEHTVAVFNAIATEEEAFDSGDFSYIELTGSIINMAWVLREGASGTS